jgi:hypothetical protein
LRSGLAPWAPPNTKKSNPVAFEQLSACRNVRAASCQFDEYFNRLTSGDIAVSRDVHIRRNCHKKNSCNTRDDRGSGDTLRKAPRSTNQACRTEACRRRKIAPLAGYSGETVIVPKLDQPVCRVYSPIIRTGLSPPSQLSTLNLAVAGKGFLCLRCKDGGNLVDRLCVSCGCSCRNSARRHHLLWSAPDLFLGRTVELKGGTLL